MQIERIEMPGLREMDAQLAALGREIATNLVKAGTRAAAELLREGWQRGAPFNPNSRAKSWTVASGETRSANYGHLNENIKVGPVKARKENAVVFKVTTGNAFWGVFREFGTVKQPASPWARPILSSLEQALIDVQVDVVRAGIERHAASGLKR